MQAGDGDHGAPVAVAGQQHGPIDLFDDGADVGRVAQQHGPIDLFDDGADVGRVAQQAAVWHGGHDHSTCDAESNRSTAPHGVTNTFQSDAAADRGVTHGRAARSSSAIGSGRSTSLAGGGATAPERRLSLWMQQCGRSVRTGRLSVEQIAFLDDAVRGWREGVTVTLRRWRD